MELNLEALGETLPPTYSGFYLPYHSRNLEREENKCTDFRTLFLQFVYALNIAFDPFPILSTLNLPSLKSLHGEACWSDLISK